MRCQFSKSTLANKRGVDRLGHYRTSAAFVFSDASACSPFVKYTGGLFFLPQLAPIGILNASDYGVCHRGMQGNSAKNRDFTRPNVSATGSLCYQVVNKRKLDVLPSFPPRESMVDFGRRSGRQQPVSVFRPSIRPRSRDRPRATLKSAHP